MLNVIQISSKQSLLKGAQEKDCKDHTSKHQCRRFALGKTARCFALEVKAKKRERKEFLHRTVMSLEPDCLAIRYQSSKTKWYKARHYGSEEITDIIFP